MKFNEQPSMDLKIIEEQTLLDITAHVGTLFYQISNDNDNKKKLAVIDLFEKFWINIPLPSLEWERNQDTNNNNRSFYINHKRQETQWSHPRFPKAGFQILELKKNEEEEKKKKEKKIAIEDQNLFQCNLNVLQSKCNKCVCYFVTEDSWPDEICSYILSMLL